MQSFDGGLGILAGDTLKGARENNLPLVGIGHKWKQGYTDQRIGPDGMPYDSYHHYVYPFLKETGLTGKVRIRESDVYAKVWLCDEFDYGPALRPGWRRTHRSGDDSWGGRSAGPCRR